MDIKCRANEDLTCARLQEGPDMVMLVVSLRAVKLHGGSESKEENLDAINIALDTDFWNGGQLFLGAVDSDYKAAIFSGTGNEGEIETAELEIFPNHRASIQGIRPIVDATATVTLKTRDRLANSVTSSSSSSMNTSGMNPVRQSGRYVKVNVKTPSGVVWTNAQGIDLVASKSGLR